MKTIHYSSGWTAVGLAREALAAAFPRNEGICFRSATQTRGKDLLMMPMQREELHERIAIAGMTQIGMVVAIVFIGSDVANPEKPIDIPFFILLRTPSKEQGAPFTQTSFIVCPKT